MFFSQHLRTKSYPELQHWEISATRAFLVRSCPPWPLRPASNQGHTLAVAHVWDVVQHSAYRNQRRCQNGTTELRLLHVSAAACRIRRCWTRLPVWRRCPHICLMRHHHHHHMGFPWRPGRKAKRGSRARCSRRESHRRPVHCTTLLWPRFPATRARLRLQRSATVALSCTRRRWIR